MNTTLKTKMESVLNAIFGNEEYNPEYEVTVHTLPYDKYKIYISSPDPLFLGSVIGKDGANISAIKTLFRIIEKRDKICVQIWVEPQPLNH